MKLKNGLLIGLIIGIGAALLYAPKSGKEVRKEVQDKLNNIPQHFFGLLESIIDLSVSVLDFARESFKEQKERLSNAMSKGLDAAKDKTEEFRKFATSGKSK